MLDRVHERSLIEDIDMRQDDVLRRLDELNGQIEEVLRRELGQLRPDTVSADAG
jgi:hypothetical protein